MNRWLGRAPASMDDMRRLQMCCDSESQCQHCPFRPEHKQTALDRLGADLLRELGG